MRPSGSFPHAPGNNPVTDSDPSGLNVRCLPGDADCGVQTKFANGGSFNTPPAPGIGSFEDILGGIQNTILGTLSAGLRGAECQAGCTPAALQPNLLDKAEAHLTRAEHLDTHSEAAVAKSYQATAAAGALRADALARRLPQRAWPGSGCRPGPGPGATAGTTGPGSASTRACPGITGC